METEKKAEDLDVKEAVIVFLLALFMIPVSLALEGMIISATWEGFVVPLGAVRITYFHAIGIAIFVFMVMFHIPRSNRAVTFGGSVASLLLAPLRLVYLYGIVWLLRWCM